MKSNTVHSPDKLFEKALQKGRKPKPENRPVGAVSRTGPTDMEISMQKTLKQQDLLVPANPEIQASCMKEIGSIFENVGVKRPGAKMTSREVLMEIDPEVQANALSELCAKPKLGYTVTKHLNL